MAKILFLAQFAPTNGKKVIPLSSEEKFYAETYRKRSIGGTLVDLPIFLDN